jgi:predicted transcriptional regulator
MKNVSFKLPETLDHELSDAARATRTTRSAVVREALRSELARRRRPRRGSCLALARDLAGSVSGPRDLAENPRRLAR